MLAVRSCVSIKAGEKAALKKKRNVVTADLRGDDYLPADILEQLPSSSAPARSDREAGEPARKRQTKAEAKAAARREQAAAEVDPHDGMPRAIQKSCAQDHKERKLISPGHTTSST